MKTHGDPGWEKYPSYFDLVVPRILELLDKHELKITFFVVGQDAALEKNQSALAQISKAGHEIGNHSYHHEPWLHLYSREEIETEITSAELAVQAATGVRPRGFRGPGFCLSEGVLEVLAERGYVYDASTFPTFIGPLARAYYFFNAPLSRKERQQRTALFGDIREGLRPLTPYRWRIGETRLFEVPVTTMPLTRAPFHVSYLHYIDGYSRGLVKAYFRLSTALCRLTGVEPSLLLHPLDFLGGDDIDCLGFFPGMRLKAERKLELVDWVLTEFREAFEVLPLCAYSARLGQRSNLKDVVPKFRVHGPDVGVARPTFEQSIQG
jgi:hypothetical protein